ncbi:MAG: hypothetical protein Q9179_004035 [Wetmoreana sp. 5 TL-2023]
MPMPALKSTGGTSKRPAPSKHRSKKPHKVAKPSKSTALKGIKACYDAGQFTDFTIICKEQEFKCHKVIVCAQSKFFEAACSNGFKESSASKIELPEDDPYLIGLMLEFLYTQTYTPDDKASCNRVDPEDPKYIPKVHISLYALGDKYAIPALCHEAVKQLRARFKSNPNAAETLANLAVKQLARHSTVILVDRKLKKLMLKLVHDVQELREDIALEFLIASSGYDTTDEDEEEEE